MGVRISVGTYHCGRDLRLRGGNWILTASDGSPLVNDLALTHQSPSRSGYQSIRAAFDDMLSGLKVTSQM